MNTKNRPTTEPNEANDDTAKVSENETSNEVKSIDLDDKRIDDVRDSELSDEETNAKQSNRQEELSQVPDKKSDELREELNGSVSIEVNAK